MAKRKFRNLFEGYCPQPKSRLREIFNSVMDLERFKKFYFLYNSRKMINKNIFILPLFLIAVVALSFSVSAWEFNGTVYDINGSTLSNATVNVSAYVMGQQGPSLVNYTTNYTNGTGWFDFSVYDNGSNQSWMYKISVIHYHNNSRIGDYIDYINQPLPTFPYMMFANGMSPNFYLHQAGVINLTAQGPAFQSFNDTNINLNTTANYTVSMAGSSGFSQFYITSVVNASTGAAVPFNNFSSNGSGVISANTNWSNVNISYNFRANNATSFHYIVKDTSTGYVMDSDFQNNYYQKTINVPADRNYSVEIFPQQSMPVSYEWNNWSATSYNITLAGSINSTYNGTTKTLNKIFNTSMNFNVRVTGYALNTTGGAGFSSLKIIPYILEPGNMIFTGGAMPANMSAWNNQGSDNFSAATGFYDITIPGPAEGENIVLFATANKSGSFYGGYLNLSLNYTSGSTQYNLTMFPMMGSSLQNISMNDGGGGGNIQITTAEQPFNVLDSNGSAITSGLHIEVKTNYAPPYGNATSFTWMVDPSGNSGTFYLPLLNTTGLTSISVYTDSYAPKTLTSLTSPSIINASNNISLSQFSPGQGVNGETLSNVKLQLLKSNSTCDVPNPDSSCTLLSSAQNPNGNPLSSIIGGGKVSFEMGLLSTGIIVKYINVDMIASGPPDAMFADSTTNSTASGSFSSAMKFGSLGPKIYDYAIISIPYSPSQLDDSKSVNVSIPTFYLDNSSGVMDWRTPVWNASSAANGTNVSNLVGNYSHFAGSDNAWQTLLTGTQCTTNQSLFNSTNPCFIDNSSSPRRVWLRIPHFSGIDPNIVGSVVAAASSSSSSSSTSSTGTANPQTSKSNSFVFDKISPGESTVVKNGDNSIGIKEIEINVDGQANSVKIVLTKYDSRPAEISVDKTGKVYQYIHIDTTNLLDKLQSATVTFKVNKTWASDNALSSGNISVYKFNETSKEWMPLNTVYDSEDAGNYYYNVTLTSFSYFAISEKSMTKNATVAEGTNNSGAANTSSTTGAGKFPYVWVILGVVVIAIAIYFFKRKGKNY